MVSHIFIHSALDEADLSANQFRVYCHLARRANGGVARPGIESMAEKCRLHPDTVRTCLKALEGRKMIEVQEREGCTRIYVLTAPEQWVTPPKQMEGSPPRKKGRPFVSTPRKQMEGYPPETNGSTPPKQIPPKDIHEGYPEKDQALLFPPASPPETAWEIDASEKQGEPKARIKGKPKKPESTADPRHAPVTRGFCDAYQEVFGIPYLHRHGRDGRQLKDFLAVANPERFTTEQIVRTAKSAMKRSTKPNAGATRFASSMGTFCAHFNDISAALSTPEVGGYANNQPAAAKKRYYANEQLQPTA